MLLRIIKAFGSGFTRLKSWAVLCSLGVSVLSLSYGYRALRENQQLYAMIKETKEAQYEWNRFHEGRYGSVVEAIKELAIHLQGDRPQINDQAYFDGDWQGFVYPASPR